MSIYLPVHTAASGPVKLGRRSFRLHQATTATLLEELVTSQSHWTQSFVKQKLTLSMPNVPVPEWLSRLYDSCFDSRQRLGQAMVDLNEKIDDLLVEGQFGQVDEILEHVDMSRLAVELQLTMLRITFAARSRLSRWRDAVEHVRHNLRSRELPVQSLLRGLLNDG